MWILLCHCSIDTLFLHFVYFKFADLQNILFCDDPYRRKRNPTRPLYYHWKLHPTTTILSNRKARHRIYDHEFLFPPT